MNPGQAPFPARSRLAAAAFCLLTIGIAATCTCARGADAPSPQPAPTVFLIGDSTMSDKPLIPAQPERGWGQLLPMYFDDAVRLRNHARNGRSSKSFRDEGRWEPVLDAIRPGDYVIIQFGHNDEKDDPKRHTEPFGTFSENLARYVQETRHGGGTAMLATPIVRRAWSDGGELEDTHGDYVVAVRNLARELDVPLLDLERASRELLLGLGPELSKRLFMWWEPGETDAFPDGRHDNTHFNAYGASRICDLAVEQIRAGVPDLARWLRTEE